MISIDIDKFYYTPNEEILTNIHLDLSKGNITSVLGRSGCGKSTLLRILMGFENSMYKSNYSFSLIPQTPYLFPWKTIAQNIALGVFDTSSPTDLTAGSGDQTLASRISKILDVVGLSGYENKYPFEISVGMSQRVAFARAMINSFQVLLLDEPFSSLDALTRRELQNWLLKIITEQNSYGLFVTHDISEAIYLSKNIYILNGGTSGNRKNELSSAPKIPATVIAHFVKEDDCFIEKNTGKVFGQENMRELEATIFSLL